MTTAGSPEERAPLPAEGRLKLSIVIPVYNEERLVLGVLRRVAAVQVEKELVVVNDCSRDGTAAVLERIEEDPTLVTSADPSGQTQVRIFHQPVNRGKGAALHRGFAEARGDAVVVQDADLEYDPHELTRVFAPIQRGPGRSSRSRPARTWRALGPRWRRRSSSRYRRVLRVDSDF